MSTNNYGENLLKNAKNTQHNLTDMSLYGKKSAGQRSLTIKETKI
jgi:hypothetical protein